MGIVNNGDRITAIGVEGPERALVDFQVVRVYRGRIDTALVFHVRSPVERRLVSNRTRDPLRIDK